CADGPRDVRAPSRGPGTRLNEVQLEVPGRLRVRREKVVECQGRADRIGRHAQVLNCPLCECEPGEAVRAGHEQNVAVRGTEDVASLRPIDGRAADADISETRDRELTRERRRLRDRTE